MTTWWRKPVDRSLLMIGGTVLVAGAGQFLMAPTPPTPTTVVMPISSLALTCPVLPGDTPGFSIAVKGVLLDGGGSATLDLQSAKPSKSTFKGGDVLTTFVKHSSSALYTATGISASNLVADASIAGTSTTTRGYASYACQPPSSSQWLIGGSSEAGRISVLVISNAEATPATVDIDLWTEDGRSAARSLSGIEIPAHSREQLSLALVDPGRTMYALHVNATSGQVTSAIFDRGQKALSSLGVDVVSTTGGPLASSIVGVIPDGSTSAVLGLLSPGTATSARISLITSDGIYALAGAEHMTLDADKLTLVRIPDDALAGDVAVLVQADTPVMAGVTERVTIRGGGDLASGAMLAPIFRVASLTVDSAVSQATALLYSDIDCLVTVTVRTGKDVYTKSGIVKAGQVQRVKLVGSSGQTHVVSIQPAVDGVVRGSVLLQRASMGAVASSVEPLASLRGYVAVPPVAPAVTR
jgi:hypothetical protein